MSNPSLNRKPQACALSCDRLSLAQNARACGVRLNEVACSSGNVAPSSNSLYVAASVMWCPTVTSSTAWVNARQGAT